MRSSRTVAVQVCAICDRTLLVGERTTRFSPEGEDFVDVCPLCQDIAAEQGWLKEGAPTTPLVSDERHRRGSLDLRTIFGNRRAAEAPVASEPILRRLSDEELGMVDAADLFNGSQFRRTIGGVAKSLGEPQASIVTFSGVNPELVITVAWDISWYQYRVAPDSAQPIRLAERGHELDELDERYTRWNAHVDPDGRLVPDIARL